MESREKLSQSIVQFENRKENPEAAKIEKVENTSDGKPRRWFSRVYWIARTLRMVQIIILVALLAMTVDLVMENWFSNNPAGILLITLFTIYLIILSVDTISIKTRRALPDTPMFLFGVLGFLLFSAAAEEIYVVPYPAKLDDLPLALMILCTIEAILFLLEVTFMILNWRQNCMRVDKCSPDIPEHDATHIHRPESSCSEKSDRTSDPLVFKGDVHDVTTSISDYQRPSHPDLVNLHKYRKIGVGQRIQYIDRPVDAPSAISLRVVEVQTEPPQRKAVSDVESLIVADVKEERAQTVPKCPVCANNWDPHRALRRIDNFGICPTFLNLAQSFGMCNCSRPPSTVLTPISAGLRTESSSATDLRVLRRTQRSNTKRHSNQEKK